MLSGRTVYRRFIIIGGCSGGPRPVSPSARRDRAAPRAARRRPRGPTVAATSPRSRCRPMPPRASDPDRVARAKLSSASAGLARFIASMPDHTSARALRGSARTAARNASRAARSSPLLQRISPLASCARPRDRVDRQRAVGGGAGARQIVLVQISRGQVHVGLEPLRIPGDDLFENRDAFASSVRPRRRPRPDDSAARCPRASPDVAAAAARSPAASGQPTKYCVASLSRTANPRRNCSISSVHGSGHAGSPVIPTASANAASSSAAETAVGGAQQLHGVSIAGSLRQRALEDVHGELRLLALQVHARQSHRRGHVARDRARRPA